MTTCRTRIVRQQRPLVEALRPDLDVVQTPPAIPSRRHRLRQPLVPVSGCGGADDGDEEAR